MLHAQVPTPAPLPRPPMGAPAYPHHMPPPQAPYNPPPGFPFMGGMPPPGMPPPGMPPPRLMTPGGLPPPPGMPGGPPRPPMPGAPPMGPPPPGGPPGSLPPPPPGEPEAKRTRTDFVLQPEEEFLDAHPGQSKVPACLLGGHAN